MLKLVGTWKYTLKHIELYLLILSVFGIVSLWVVFFSFCWLFNFYFELSGVDEWFILSLSVLSHMKINDKLDVYRTNISQHEQQQYW